MTSAKDNTDNHMRKQKIKKTKCGREENPTSSFISLTKNNKMYQHFDTPTRTYRNLKSQKNQEKKTLFLQGRIKILHQSELSEKYSKA